MFYVDCLSDLGFLNSRTTITPAATSSAATKATRLQAMKGWLAKSSCRVIGLFFMLQNYPIPIK